MSPRATPAALLALALALTAGCGGERQKQDEPLPPDPSRVAIPIGPAPRWQPPPTSDAVRAARPVDGMRCSKQEPDRFGVHLELFAERRVLIVAQGIGLAPPLRRDGAYVRGGRCSYPIVTHEPTGVLEVAPGRELRLGHLFELWGQPLSRRRIASFEGEVQAFVAGRPWRGDPRDIPLRRHAQIVLEVGGYIPPHPSYRFPPGL
jgi:hypothetical protein